MTRSSDPYTPSPLGSSQIGVDLSNGHPKSSQIGVDFTHRGANWRALASFLGFV
jgi:hypothetical protein